MNPLKSVDTHFAWEYIENQDSPCRSALTVMLQVNQLLFDETAQVHNILADSADQLSMTQLKGLIQMGELSGLVDFVNQREAEGLAVVPSALATMRSFWREQLLPKVANALECHLDGPVKALQAVWNTAIEKVRVLERALACGENKPKEDEINNATHTLANLDMDSDLKLFEKAASERLQVLRSQLLHRVLGAAKTLGAVWPEVLAADVAKNRQSILQNIGKVQQEGEALRTWVAGNNHDFSLVSADWFASADEASRAAAVFEVLAKQSKDTAYVCICILCRFTYRIHACVCMHVCMYAYVSIMFTCVHNIV